MKWIAFGGAVMLGVATAFGTLPFGWAHDIANAVCAGMAAFEGTAFGAQYISEKRGNGS